MAIRSLKYSDFIQVFRKPTTFKVTDSHLRIDAANKTISLNLQVDESICTMYDYFDIFLGRMQMCRHAADVLGAAFKLTVNGSKVL